MYWQNLVRRFHASGSGSLRAFANYDYFKVTPLKIGVASAIGAGSGLIGASRPYQAFESTRRGTRIGACASRAQYTACAGLRGAASEAASYGFMQAVCRIGLPAVK